LSFTRGTNIGSLILLVKVKNKFPGDSFATFAILSERSERAVKKKSLNREEREGREELHVFVGLRPKRKD
jgi:hypothetical protein